MSAGWVVPRAEWEALGWEWIPDTCPTIAAIVEEFERDKTATGTGVVVSERCGGGFDGCRPDEAVLRDDPYAFDVLGESNPRWLCPVCYQELCGEI